MVLPRDTKGSGAPGHVPGGEMGATGVDTERRKQYILSQIPFLPSFPLHLSLLKGKGELLICSLHCCRERYSRHLVVSFLAVPTAAAIGNYPNHHNGSNNSPNDASIQSYVHGCCMGREELAQEWCQRGSAQSLHFKRPHHLQTEWKPHCWTTASESNSVLDSTGAVSY